jgi:hypothetical protein
MDCGIRFETWVIEAVIRPAVLHTAGEDAWVDLSRYSRFQQDKHWTATMDAFEQHLHHHCQDPARSCWMLYQPFVVDKTHGWYGHPDLVVRRDVLPWLDHLLDSRQSLADPQFMEQLATRSPASASSRNYRHPGWAIIDIKYSSTLTNKPLYQAQLWVYLLAINDMTKDIPSSTSTPTTTTQSTSSPIEPVNIDDLFLLGRGGCVVKAFARLSQLAHVESSLADARDWLSRLNMNDSLDWKLVPTPSVRELMVCPSRDESCKWDAVLDEISAQQGDVCHMYKVGPAGRAKLAFPPLPWWNPLCTAKYLGVRVDDQPLVDAMAVAARKVRNRELVPEATRVSWTQALGKPRAVRHCTVAFDFEFVYDLHLVQSFKDGDTQSWVFSVAAGIVDGGVSTVASGFVDCVRTDSGELNDQGELELMGRWLTWLKSHQKDQSTLYLIHWSPAELQCLKRVRAKVKESMVSLKELFLWWDRCVVTVDGMGVLIKNQVVVPGAMEYGLKAVYANLFRSKEPPVPPVITISGSSRKRKTATQESKDEKVVLGTPKATPQTTTRAAELAGTGLVGDQAALVAYDLAHHKRFGLEPTEAMQRVLAYNMDDVRMTAAIWSTLVKD